MQNLHLAAIAEGGKAPPDARVLFCAMASACARGNPVGSILLKDVLGDLP